MSKVRPIVRYISRGLAFFLLLVVVAVAYLTWETTAREVDYHRDIAPANGRYISAGDVEIFIQESGPSDQEKILFIHGTGAWGEIWRETMDPLNEAGYHTITLDLPPFGFSGRPADASYDRDEQAQRILNVIDSLGTEQITLVGHSFGGGPTIEAALLAPEKIKRLVLIDVGDLVGPVPFEEQPTGPSIVARIAGISALRNTLLATLVTNPRQTQLLLQQLIHDPVAATEARIEMLQQPSSIENSTHDLGLWLVANFLHPQPKMVSNTPANYQQLDMPILLIWGEEDTLTPLTQGEKMQAIMVGAQLEILADVGHIPQIEAPEKVVELLKQFLGQPHQ